MLELVNFHIMLNQGLLPGQIFLLANSQCLFSGNFQLVSLRFHRSGAPRVLIFQMIDFPNDLFLS